MGADERAGVVRLAGEMVWRTGIGIGWVRNRQGGSDVCFAGRDGAGQGWVGLSTVALGWAGWGRAVPGRARLLCGVPHFAVIRLRYTALHFASASSAVLRLCCSLPNWALVRATMPSMVYAAQFRGIVEAEHLSITISNLVKGLENITTI